jgi:hypothetical protein
VPSERPVSHPNSEVDVIRGFITASIDATRALGVTVEDCWLDPSGPVDATLRFRGFACVWTEQNGWTRGEFVSGIQGERTVLANPVLLGGGVLLDPYEFAVLLRDGTTAVQTPTRAIRARDGLTEALQGFND